MSTKKAPPPKPAPAEQKTNPKRATRLDRVGWLVKSPFKIISQLDGKVKELKPGLDEAGNPFTISDEEISDKDVASFTEQGVIEPNMVQVG